MTMTNRDSMTAEDWLIIDLKSLKRANASLVLRTKKMLAHNENNATENQRDKMQKDVANVLTRIKTLRKRIKEGIESI